MGKMPAVFIGHGSPMNAIEDNEFTRNWRDISEKIPKPEAILSISAHWYTKGTKILNHSKPNTIHDMYGFPKELYDIIYNSPGSPELASKVKDLILREAVYDNSWGIDHGTWSVLVHMYPNRDIPVIQLSIDASAPPEVHYQIGKELRELREQGVLIIGSGNVVHNLRILDYSIEEKGFLWAHKFDDYVRDNIVNRNYDNVVKYQSFGESAKQAVPTPDHYFPLLYILGAAYTEDKISVYNNKCILGSLSMTSYLFE
ncbi:MAG: ygiD [Lachnospiraceae bacterium]|jgi:4,5-DOPA dioxygenase extradiol|nr:ygiD [Lachnospiraceae bacterium]